MVIIGIDYGDVRTGIAVCDKLEMMASGAGCIKAEGFKKAAEGVAAKAKELKAELIVVGNPVNMDGSEGERSLKCRDFAAYLSEITGIPSEMYDERLTTVSAHRYLAASGVDGRKHKKHVDELSAQIILEDFLSARKKALANSRD